MSGCRESATAVRRNSRKLSGQKGAFTPGMSSLPGKIGHTHKAPAAAGTAPGVADYVGVDMAEGTCTIEGCDRAIHARGRCNRHYGAWRKAHLKATECSVEGCGLPLKVVARQLCEKHNFRFQKYGDPLTTGRPDLGKTTEARFWEKVDKNGPLGCWIWTASFTSAGYGQFIVMRGHRGYPRQAHRIAWELLRGPIPDDLVIDHRCRTRACVNPDHLEPVTNKENILRGISVPAINGRKTHCIRGHAFTPENTYRPARGGRQCITCQKLRDKGRAR